MKDRHRLKTTMSEIFYWTELENTHNKTSTTVFRDFLCICAQMCTFGRIAMLIACLRTYWTNNCVSVMVSIPINRRHWFQFTVSRSPNRWHHHDEIIKFTYSMNFHRIRLSILICAIQRKNQTSHFISTKSNGYRKFSINFHTPKMSQKGKECPIRHP